jgi:hypothetical protein
MGRKRLDEGRRVTVGAKVSESLAAQLDEVRGDVSRSAFLEAALREALVTAGAVPVTGKRASPVRTGRLRPAGDVPPLPPVPAPSRKALVRAETRRAAEQSPARRDESCPHPKARVIKGYCGACGTHAG